MKKFMSIGIAALVVLLLCGLVLTGCPTEDNGGSVKSMTFEDTTLNAHKEFTINENLGFKAKFFDDALGGIVPAGSTVSGKITGASDIWTEDLNGIAKNMKSSDSTVNGMLDTEQVVIDLTYSKDAAGKITDVTVWFPDSAGGTDATAMAAQGMMGGTYTRK